MKEFPSCFGESGVQISNPSSSSTTNKTTSAQNLVTCVYHYRSQTFSGFITITWIKHLMAQGLSICIENSTKESLCKVDIKPWLFSKKKGLRNLVVNSTKVNIFWDLSSAKFGSSPEPLEGFCLAIALNQELCLLLGDLPNEALKKIDIPSSISPKANYVAKKEHIFGKRLYNSKARFFDKGKLHDVRIEYDPGDGFGKCLMIFVDKKAVLQVTRLMWKFRGNETILVDGIYVEVYWDVYNWLFGGVMSNAVFLFRSSVCGEKLWSKRALFEPSALSLNGWDKSKEMVDSQQGHGFSLVLCAWKNE
ncbi:hypothetical protein PHJA_001374500 [Phtheirospermum japonicum]|uniref:Uncharacterized protein n=1 Tax=Phtheirospermum japonicum TaxID=374723 RepID=A0A830C7F5_9LAMI|nr:hypothetical protein PHJA_001374500 [Phtheirospermum japonicum]